MIRTIWSKNSNCILDCSQAARQIPYLAADDFMHTAGHYNKWSLGRCTRRKPNAVVCRTPNIWPFSERLPDESHDRAESASLHRPRKQLQRFSSIKGKPSASRGNSKCGESSKITSVRFGDSRLLPEIAFLGALT